MGLLTSVKSAVVDWLAPELSRELKAMVQQSIPIPKMPAYYQGIPRFNDWSTDIATREGLYVSTWIYACINLRAKCLSSCPWVVEEKQWNDDRWKRIEHPLANLLSCPNPYRTGKQLIELSSMHRDLGGNAFWHIIINGGKPYELWPLKPDFVRPIPDTQNFLAGYYIWIGGTPFILSQQEVFHLMFTSPFDDYIGLPPIRAAWQAVQTDVAATEWNRSMMNNRAVSDVVLSPKEMLDYDAWKELRQQVREQHSGAENSHMPWVLGGGIDVKRLGLTAVEMDWVESRRWGREEICAVFGIPLPVLTGSKQHGVNSLVSGSNDAEIRNFWVNTLEPLLMDYEAQFNLSLVPFWDEGAKYGEARLRVRYDLSNVTAAQIDYAARVTNAKILYEMGIGVKALNRKLELGFYDDELPAVNIAQAAVEPDPNASPDLDLSKLPADPIEAKKFIAEYAKNKREMDGQSGVQVNRPPDRSPNQAVEDYYGTATNKPSVFNTPAVAANLPQRNGVN